MGMNISLTQPIKQDGEKEKDLGETIDQQTEHGKSITITIVDFFISTYKWDINNFNNGIYNIMDINKQNMANHMTINKQNMVNHMTINKQNMTNHMTIISRTWQIIWPSTNRTW